MSYVSPGPFSSVVKGRAGGPLAAPAVVINSLKRQPHGLVSLSGDPRAPPLMVWPFREGGEGGSAHNFAEFGLSLGIFCRITLEGWEAEVKKVLYGENFYFMPLAMRESHSAFPLALIKRSGDTY